MKRISLILSALFIFSVLLGACQNSSGGVNANLTSADTDAETTEADARNAIPDNLPATDFEGREFRIYSSTERETTFYADEQNADVVNDAIITAIGITEERFDVDIVNIDSGGDDVKHNEKIRTSINVGDDTFDVAENHDALSGGLAVQGLLLNLYKMPNLDFSKPWWPSNAVESLTYRDQMYLASSNISYRGFQQTRVLFFNKNLMADRNMEEPYTYVFDGTWTLDKFISMTKDLYEDLNGNSKVDNEDLFGYVAKGPIYCYLEQYHLTPVQKTDDGELILGINNDRTVTLVGKMYDLLHGSAGGTIKDYSTTEKMFSSEHALFAFGEISDASLKYRYTEVNYGIVMQPKLDEAQEKYYAEYTDRFFLFPVTTKDINFSTIIFEAMSAEGYKKIFPAYYEIALKQKYTYDNESMRVLDIINDARVIDFSYVYCNDINNMLNTLFFSTPSKDFASLYAKNEKNLNKKLKEITKSYEKLEARTAE